MKILITGYNGFIAKHLVNTLVYKNNFKKDNISFLKEDEFNNLDQLRKKLIDSELIIHLAGVNRHHDPNFIYSENIRLTRLLIDNISDKTNTIIFSSSIQQDLKNSFGEAKLKCKQIFKEWAKSNNKNFINLKIPNVYGPFGKPNYNSFVSTFCSNIVNDKKINEVNPNNIDLIYVNDLIDEVIDCISKPNQGIIEVTNFKNIKSTNVKDVHKLLLYQWNLYNNYNTIPELNSEFEINLFNTLRSFIPVDEYFPRKLLKHSDERGYFSEIIRSKGQGQFSISETKNKITRGNHFHTRKIERFIVVQGKAMIKLRKVDSDRVFSFTLDGSDLNFLDIPIWYSHSITNIGDEKLITLFWINEPYDPLDSDTFINNV